MQLINIHEIPDSRRYKKGIKFHSQNILELDKIKYEDQGLVDFLLSTSSVAIYTLTVPSNYTHPWFTSLVLLSANLNKGHSEGKNTILVQDVTKSIGPWVLINSHGNKSFYLQNVTLPYATTPTFQPEVDTPSKIKKRYICIPNNSSEIFNAFTDNNYIFKNEKMPEKLYQELTS